MVRKNSKNKKNHVKSEIDGDVLSIDCRDCGRIPDAACAECIRCIITEMKKHGYVERVRMRTGRDIEISGPAAEILCELSFIDKSSSVIRTKKKGRCKSCNYSGDRIIDIAWKSFPVPDFAGARGKLMSFKTGRNVCDICVQKTYRALDQAELTISELSEKALLISNGRM